MQKLKIFLFTFFMTLCMVVVPVSAEETTDLTKLSIEKDLVAPAGTQYPALSFSFTVTPTDVTEGTTLNGYNVYKGVALTTDTYTIDFAAGTAAADLTDGNGTTFTGAQKSATVDFSDVTYPRPGIYRYTVSETSGNSAAITYDDKQYEVDVYVANNTEGTPAVKYVISKLNDTKTPIIFQNSYLTQSVSVKKVVTGNLADHTKSFPFVVTLDSNDCLKENDTLTATVIRQGGTSETVTLTVGTDNNISLKDNETLTITSLPKGTHVTVYENQGTTDVYEVTLTDLVTSATIDTKKVDTTIADADQSYQFTNSKNGTVPNTGVNETVIPYLIVLAAAALYVGIKVKEKKAI